MSMQQFALAKYEFGKRLERRYKFPASFNEAKVHQRAHRNGYKSSTSYFEIKGKDEERSTMLCPCCENFVNTVDIPLCYSTYPQGQDATQTQNKEIMGYIAGSTRNFENTFQIQSGISLFFCFVKLALTYLMIRLVVMDLYNIITNSFGHYCSSISA